MICSGAILSLTTSNSCKVCQRPTSKRLKSNQIFQRFRHQPVTIKQTVSLWCSAAVPWAALQTRHSWPTWLWSPGSAEIKRTSKGKKSGSSDLRKKSTRDGYNLTISYADCSFKAILRTVIFIWSLCRLLVNLLAPNLFHPDNSLPKIQSLVFIYLKHRLIQILQSRTQSSGTHAAPAHCKWRALMSPKNPASCWHPSVPKKSQEATRIKIV